MIIKTNELGEIEVIAKNYKDKKKDEEHYHTIWTFQKTSLAA